MPDDKKTPADDPPDPGDDIPPIVPEIEACDDPAEKIREKGEPFDGNVA